MHPFRSRPPPFRDRALLQPALPAAPDAEAAGAQAAAPTQQQRLAAALRIDTTDIVTLAEIQPGSEDPHVDGCALISAGRRGPHHSMAPAAWQALCRGLPQTRRPRYSRVSCLPSPWMRGPARQSQPRHAYMSSIPGSVAVLRQHLDSHQPAGAATTLCRPPPCRRQARPMAARTTVGQPLAAPQAVGHHTAVDSILHCSVAAGSPGDPGAHRSQGAGSSQRPDAPRLAPGGIRHQAARRTSQPLAQREAAGLDSGAVPAALVPWVCSFPCHRMCCGPDTLLWFALYVFRSADMIGIDGPVLFLPQKLKKWGCSLEPARGRAGVAHHPLNAMHPVPLPPHTQVQHLPPHARACLVRTSAMCRSTVSALHVTCH